MKVTINQYKLPLFVSTFHVPHITDLMGSPKYHIYLKLPSLKQPKHQLSLHTCLQGKKITLSNGSLFSLLHFPFKKLWRSADPLCHTVSCQFETNPHCTRSSNISNITASQSVTCLLYDTSMFITVFTKAYRSPLCP
jgi:hypothetical protein